MLWATWRACAKESGATTENLHKNQFLSSACVAGTEGLVKNHHLKAPFPLLHYSPFFPLASLTITRSVSPFSFLIYKMISFFIEVPVRKQHNMWTQSAVFETSLLSYLSLPYIGFLKSEENQLTGKGYNCGHMGLLPSSCNSPVKLRQCFSLEELVWATKSFGKRFRSTFSPSIALVSTWQHFIPNALFGLWNCSYSTEDKFFVI